MKKEEASHEKGHILRNNSYCYNISFTDYGGCILVGRCGVAMTDIDKWLDQLLDGFDPFDNSHNDFLRKKPVAKADILKRFQEEVVRAGIEELKKSHEVFNLPEYLYDNVKFDRWLDERITALEALGSAESQQNEPFCLHSGKDVNSLGSIGPRGDSDGQSDTASASGNHVDELSAESARKADDEEA